MSRIPRPEIPERFNEITGQKLNSFKTPQELEAFLKSRPVEARTLAESGIDRKDLQNHVQKGLFRKLLWDYPKAIVTAPFKLLSKGAGWYLKHPIRNTLLGGALLYFGAPYIISLYRQAEGAAIGPGLDWLGRRIQSLRSLTGGFAPGAGPDVGGSSFGTRIM